MYSLFLNITKKKLLIKIAEHEVEVKVKKKLNLLMTKYRVF